jgi:hypothetical protein
LARETTVQSATSALTTWDTVSKWMNVACVGAWTGVVFMEEPFLNNEPVAGETGNRLVSYVDGHAE